MDRTKIFGSIYYRAGLGFKFGDYKLAQTAGSNVCSRDRERELH
jgi:hypothetical protein